MYQNYPLPHSTYLAKQVRQSQHLASEHAQTYHDSVELTDEASAAFWRNLPQVHWKSAECNTLEEKCKWV